MLKEKILNGIKLTSDEVNQIVWEDTEEDEGIFIHDTEFGDDTRWFRFIGVILKIDNRFFRIWYLKGLTEYQPNEYESQVAEEVVPVEVTRVEWEGKK